MRCDLDKVPSVGLFGMVVHQGGLRAQKMFDKYGLNKSQAGILFKLNVTAPSITSAIQKMEKAGFIKRQPDEKDQRIMRLYLDEKGKACIEHVKEVAMQMDEIMFRGISQEEKLLLRRIMIQIFDNLKEEPRFHTSGESKTER